eukprot:gene844-4116_t
MKLNTSQIRQSLFSAIVFLSIAALLLCTIADAENNAVHTLSPKTLDAALSDDSHWLINYYAPWCGHCNRLKPVWKDLAATLDRMNSKIRVGMFDCTSDRDLCTKQGVVGYPAIRIYRHDGLNYTYLGVRTVDALLQYSAFMTRDVITHLTSADEVRDALASRDVVFVRILPVEDNGAAAKTYWNVAASLLPTVMCYDMPFEISSTTPLEGKISRGQIVRVSNEQVTVFMGNMHDSDEVSKWMQTRQWHTSFELTRETAKSYTSVENVKPLVILTISDASSSETFVTQYKQFAKQSPLNNKIQFTWLEYEKLPGLAGGVWSLKPSELPVVIVHNATTSQFYRMTSSPTIINPPESDMITSEVLLDENTLTHFIEEVLAGKVDATDPHSLKNIILGISAESLTTIISRSYSSFMLLREEAPLVFYSTVVCIVGVALVFFIVSREPSLDNFSEDNKGERDRNKPQQK